MPKASWNNQEACTQKTFIPVRQATNQQRNLKIINLQTIVPHVLAKIERDEIM